MRKTSWCKRLVVPMLVAALCLGGGVALAAKWVKVGGILDTTGATSDVGRDYALGVQEAIPTSMSTAALTAGARSRSNSSGRTTPIVFPRRSPP